MPRILKTKGKCVLNDKLKESYPFLEKTEINSEVFCKKCKSTFSIASGGNSDILRHTSTGKHRFAVNAASSSRSINTHFPSKFDYTVACREGVWTYHVINANQSFKSSTCATKIFQKCFDMDKFSCCSTKCQAIVVNVFAPKAEQMLHKDLESCNYVSVYTDSSNHGNIKLFPVLVRYFIPTRGIFVKVLDITSEPGETSKIINDLILAAADKFGIKNKIVSFCGDNAKVNFGGVTRGGENNVFYRMKLWVPHLIGIGCVAHIAHNALKYACDVLPFDVECVIVKIYSYFYIYTTRAQALKEFCELASVEYLKLLGYAKTRFLALGPAIKRIIELYEPLKMLFTSLQKGEKLLKEFFNNGHSKFWLLFAQEQAEIFAECVLKVESDEVTAIEVVQYVDELKNSLKMREEDGFLTAKTAAEKQHLIENGFDSNALSKTCKEFFVDAVHYIDLWNAPIMELKVFSWTVLRKMPVWSEVEVVMKKLDQINLFNAAENSGKLHTQFGFVKNYCSERKIKQWKEQKVPIPKRWTEIFNYLDAEDCDYKEIAKIVEYILCLPGSTCSVERIFSGINQIWSQEKNRLKVETLRAIISVKTNFKMQCLEFYKFLKENPEMLRQIASADKYNHNKDS